MSAIERDWYYTRYALTDGIAVERGHRAEHIGPTCVSFNRTYFRIGYIGRDTFETHAEAVKAAEKMRTRKIASLQRSIAKLALLTFN